MKRTIQGSIIVLCSIFFLFAIGCAPKVGSEAWCAKMKEKPKGEWSANEAADYAKHCLFKSQEEEPKEE